MGDKGEESRNSESENPRIREMMLRKIIESRSRGRTIAGH